MTFKDTLAQYDWAQTSERIYATTPKEVEQILQKDKISLAELGALLSPAAENFIEEMAQISHHKTLKRFGNTIQMFAPMYLSNECQNICTYCGFSVNNITPRMTLSDTQILAEVKIIKSMGFDHVLLVTGESHKKVGVPYLKHAIELIRKHFSQISIEVQPLDRDEYEELIPSGLHAVLVYQETYHRERYKLHHPKGKKSNFDYRLETPDRLGKSGIHKIGIGVLLGLEDWRVDCFMNAAHLEYLEKHYWQSKYAISFPRLRPCSGVPDLVSNITDKQLVQLICAFRIFNDEVELSLSTRESEHFRNHAFKLGITSMSAGSKTDPGGYSNPDKNLEQFEISDERSPSEIKKMLSQNEYETVWKDWDPIFD